MNINPNRHEKFEENLSKEGKKVRPDAWFAFIMRMRIMNKGWSLFWSGRAFSFKYAGVIAMIIVLLGGSGVGSYAYASDDVTEGTPLYPIKMGIENIEAMLPRSPENIPKFEMKRAHRRLAEAAKIAERLGKNDDIILKDRKAFGKTFEDCENHLRFAMDRFAMDRAEREFDTDEADRLIQEMRENFQAMAGKIDKMKDRPSLEPFRGRMRNMQDDMMHQVKRMDDADEAIKNAIRMRHERVMLRFSEDFEDNEAS